MCSPSRHQAGNPNKQIIYSVLPYTIATQQEMTIMLARQLATEVTINNPSSAEDKLVIKNLLLVGCFALRNMFLIGANE